MIHFRSRATGILIVLFLGLILGAGQQVGAQELRNERLYAPEGTRLTTVAVLPVMASPTTRNLVVEVDIADETAGFRKLLGDHLVSAMRGSSIYRHLPGLVSHDSSLNVLQRSARTDEYLSLAQQYSELGIIDTTVARNVAQPFESRYLLVPFFSFASLLGEAQLEAFIWDRETGEVAWRSLGAASTEDWGQDVLTKGLMESFLVSLPLPKTSD